MIEGVVLREAMPDDVPFIVHAWMRSDLGPDRERVAWCLGDGVTLVAVTDGVLLGFACARPPSTLHFVYVKRDARRFGIAQTLVNAMGIRGRVRMTHRPRRELRALCNDRGYYWQPLTRAELAGRAA